jgi:hypothetical protein
MLGVLVWIVVILLICFSVTGWHWIIFYVVILPFSTLLFFFYVDFPENRFNIKRFKNDIKYIILFALYYYVFYFLFAEQTD